MTKSPRDFLLLDGISSNLRQLRHARWVSRCLARLGNVYRSATEGEEGGQLPAEKAAAIFGHLLESAGHDHELLDAQLEAALPASLDDALEMVESGLFFRFRAMEEVQDEENMLDQTLNDAEQTGDGGGEAED